MIDHTAVNVSDAQSAKAFYSTPASAPAKPAPPLFGASVEPTALALGPLGYSLAFEQGEFLGFADSAGLSLGVVRRDPVGGAHVAFPAEDRATVDAFYEAAMAAGGKDNGPPGLPAHYHENYYAAFVHDPDGNDIEASARSRSSRP